MPLSFILRNSLPLPKRVVVQLSCLFWIMHIHFQKSRWSCLTLVNHFTTVRCSSWPVKSRDPIATRNKWMMWQCLAPTCFFSPKTSRTWASCGSKERRASHSLFLSSLQNSLGVCFESFSVQIVRRKPLLPFRILHTPRETQKAWHLSFGPIVFYKLPMSSTAVASASPSPVGSKRSLSPHSDASRRRPTFRYYPPLAPDVQTILQEIAQTGMCTSLPWTYHRPKRSKPLVLVLQQSQDPYDSESTSCSEVSFATQGHASVVHVFRAAVRSVLEHSFRSQGYQLRLPHEKQQVQSSNMQQSNHTARQCFVQRLHRILVVLDAILNVSTVAPLAPPPTMLAVPTKPKHASPSNKPAPIPPGAQRLAEVLCHHVYYKQTHQLVNAVEKLVFLLRKWVLLVLWGAECRDWCM